MNVNPDVYPYYWFILCAFIPKLRRDWNFYHLIFYSFHWSFSFFYSNLKFLFHLETFSCWEFQKFAFKFDFICRTFHPSNENDENLFPSFSSNNNRITLNFFFSFFTFFGFTQKHESSYHTITTAPYPFTAGYPLKMRWINPISILSTLINSHWLQTDASTSFSHDVNLFISHNIFFLLLLFK